MMYFLNKSFWENPWLIILLTTSLVLVIFLRYIITSWIYKLIIEKLADSKRNVFGLHRTQILREIRWSLSSSIIFAILSLGCYYLYQQGYTAIYTEVDRYSLGYTLVTPLIILLLYETYYYWLHRWMHLPQVFKLIHKVHHESIQPTVFTSFSFHPMEALLQFLFFPLLIMVLPIHPLILGIVLMILTVSALINHSGVEVFGTGKFVKHFIGANHHDLHHTEFRSNFGLYLTYWDKWMKTESRKLQG
jgi:Delta7-sterol 5-desaturase